jgi:HSP20 family protein
MNTVLKKMNTGFPRLLSDWFDPFTFFDTGLTGSESRLGFTLPTVNVKETGKEYFLELAAPGLERKDFKVEADNNVLSISVEKKEEKKEEGKDFTRQEFSFNSFRRSFELPENSNTDKIDAKYVDGILKLVIPKKEITAEKPPKEIAVS